MTTRFYPVEHDQLENLTDIESVFDAGFVICEAREECDQHPGQPPACYLCL